MEVTAVPNPLWQENAVTKAQMARDLTAGLVEAVKVDVLAEDEAREALISGLNELGVYPGLALAGERRGHLDDPADDPL